MTIVQKWKAVSRAFTQPTILNEQKLELLANQLGLDQSDSAKLEEAKCKSLISTEE